MKKFFALIVTAIMSVACLFSAVGCGNNNELIVYTEAGFAPWEYTRKGSMEVVGVDMEIANYIANKYGYKLRVVNGSFDTIIAGISEDNALGIAGISWTAKRAENILYSDFYWGGAFQTVVYLKSAAPELSEDGVFLKSNFNGKSIVCQSGTTSHLMASEKQSEWGVSLTALQQVYLALDEVKADSNGNTYLIVDSTVAMQLVENDDAIAYATIEDVDAESYGIVAKKGNTALIEKVNAALAELLVVDEETGKNQIEKWYDIHTAQSEE